MVDRLGDDLRWAAVHVASAPAADELPKLVSVTCRALGGKRRDDRAGVPQGLVDSRRVDRARLDQADVDAVGTQLQPQGIAQEREGRLRCAQRAPERDRDVTPDGTDVDDPPLGLN